MMKLLLPMLFAGTATVAPAQATPTRAKASTPATAVAMPAMDHSAMSGMEHGKMDMGSAPSPARAADPMAGMDPRAMGSMVMPDGTVMQMTATPKSIVRRKVGPAEAALQGFADAIEVGNRELAIARLAPDLVVVENGSEDDYAGYVGSHLASDIAFGKTVKPILLSREVRVVGRNHTVIVSASRPMSNRSDRAVDLDVAETATMTKVGDDWKISRLA